MAPSSITEGIGDAWSLTDTLHMIAEAEFDLRRLHCAGDGRGIREQRRACQGDVAFASE